jgi:putative transposase
MVRKRYKPEQIVRLMRQADVLSSQGGSVTEICREIGVTEHTYYRWRRVYQGIFLSSN